MSEALERKTVFMKNNLMQCLTGYNMISTIGMCKNAGKTTVLNYLVENYNRHYVLGITSIGYDGEKEDTITKLPKPRIKVYPNMHIATAQKCLDQSEIAYEQTHDTNIMTAIGKVKIIKALSCGFVEVSGPSIASQIKIVSSIMLSLGCQKVILDGAAGRISFASYADCAVLSVGAAMSSNLNKVIKSAQHQIEMLKLEVCTKKDRLLSVYDKAYQVQFIDGVNYFVFRGAMADCDLREITKTYKDMDKAAIVKDASSIFISPRAYHKFCSKNGKVQVLNKINLVALTINPMSPYGKWFERQEFLKQMQDCTDLPVYNIFDEKVKDDDE